MKKNTESLGSIFDAQPSEITGNIRSLSDPAEPVVGYITASSAQEKRIFIKRRGELEGDWFSMWCTISRVGNSRADFIQYFDGRTPALVPFEAEYSPTNPDIIIGYFASSPTCVDCTTRGGTNVKPSFW